MNEIFHRKSDLLNAINKLTPKPLLLIDFLNHLKTHKFTYFTNHKKLFKKLNKLKIKKHYYINEIVINGIPRKPYLDLEKIYDTEQTYIDTKDELIEKLQNDIITVFKNQYNQIITKNDILLLESSGKVINGFKISFHIIIEPSNKTFYYTNSKFTDSSAYHLYTSLIDLNPYYKDLIDGQVYNRDVNFRIVNSAKNFTDQRTLKPIDESIDELRYMLTYIDPKFEAIQLKTPIIEQSTKSERIMTNKQIPQTNIFNTLLKMVQKYHPSAVYNGIYQNIYHNFNYTDRKELCPIGCKTHTGSNGFFVFENDRGYYFECHSCTGHIHIGYIDESNDFLDNAIQINQKYLIMDRAIDKNPKEEVKDIIKEWLDNKEIKTLAIKSAMGTGKTSMIKKILEFKEDSLKKILWITHRQTLTKQLYGSFKKLGFKSYMNGKGCLIDHDKIIVQIDSLMRISNLDDEFEQYDLVIIDEVEGCLNHFSSKHIEGRSRSIFNFMLDVIKHSNKLLVLDADIGVRTNLFINNFPKSIIVNNNYSVIQKTFVIMNSAENFDKKMFKDIDDGKNVCIVSMSANALEHITDKLIKKKIKYMMHTSKTDDKLKNELEDVNSFWVKYQVVLYSPTIESGVDFSVKHFDKIYCILKSGQMTCSQRGFLQMVGRIRQFIDPSILCYYDGSVNVDSLVYTYDDVLSYCRYYEEINGKKMIEEVKYETIVKDDGRVKRTRTIVKISLYDYIIMYNETEILNKNPTIFMTILNSLIQRAGHKLKFDTVEKCTKMESDNKLKDKMAKVNEKKYDIKDLRQLQRGQPGNYGSPHRRADAGPGSKPTAPVRGPSLDRANWRRSSMWRTRWHGKWRGASTPTSPWRSRRSWRLPEAWD